MAERMKLSIQKVNERETVGQNNIPKLSFTATKKGEAPLWYCTFRTSLFEIIEKKGEIDCEVDTKEREVSGNTYVDRKVTQIYVDGQPVGGQRQGGGNFFRPDNTASIEAQTAAKITGELIVAGIVKPESNLGKQLLEWLKSKMAPLAPKPTTDTRAGVTPPKQADKGNDKVEQVKTTPKNPGELCKWAQKHGKQYGPTWVAKEADVNSVSEIKDVGKVYKDIKDLTGWED